MQTQKRETQWTILDKPVQFWQDKSTWNVNDLSENWWRTLKSLVCSNLHGIDIKYTYKEDEVGDFTHILIKDKYSNITKK